MPNLPQTITLSDEDAALIGRLNAREAGLQSMMKNFQDQFEARATTLREDNAKVWKDLAAKYGFDLNNVIWQASGDGRTLVPVQMKLVP